MSSISPSQLWSCPNCSEKIELQFDNCWKCGSNQEGKVQADFDKLLSIPSETKSAHDETESVGQKRGIPWSTFALVSILILSIMFGVRFASKGDVVVFAVAWIPLVLILSVSFGLVSQAIYCLGKKAGRLE